MRIFLSYRRSDSQDITARLADRLLQLPRVKSVFLDVGSIAGGEDFPTRLKRELAAANVCLVLIGANWIGVDENGETTRIFGEQDFVRMEVSDALRLGKRVIPVLIDGSEIPEKKDMPEDIHSLADRNAIFLRHSSFDQDVEILADTLLTGNARGRLAGIRRFTPANMVFRFIMGLIVAVFILLTIGVVSFSISGGRSLESILGDRALLFVLVAFVFLSCQLIAFRLVKLPAIGGKEKP